MDACCLPSASICSCAISRPPFVFMPRWWASALTEEEFSERRGASFESVEGNLAHVMGAQVVWLERWTGGSNPRPVLEFQKTRGLRTIREAFAQSHAALSSFVSALSDDRLD